MKWSEAQLPTGNRLADLHTFSFETVRQLYDNQNPVMLTTYQQRQQQLSGLHSASHRSSLVDAIREMMQALGANDASLSQLERLRDERAVAVVTGQQSGLFGGPLYSIYKALTAVGLAERLERELGCPVVPVFWVASEDHDWDEVNHTYVLDSAGAVRRLALNTPVHPHRMVYHQPLTGETVRETIAALHKLLPDGAHSQATVEQLQSTFRPGMSLSTWFIALMQRWLGDRGLVFYDPCLPKLRRLAAPVWELALSRRETVQDALDEVYREVQSGGYTPEVIRDERNSNVFVVRDGNRYVLEQTDDGRGLQARGLGESKPIAEWLDEARTSPQSFSSNVLLRPVVQDFILPTLCYVGGPSEIAYYPLSRGIFHALGRTLPPLVLRQRVTLFPYTVRANMERHGISKEQLRTQVSLVDAHVMDAGGAALDTSGAQLQQLMTERLQSWAAAFANIGSQIADVSAHSQERIHRELERMTQKAKRLVAERDAVTVKQLTEIERFTWTDGHLQERRLCAISFLARFGTHWLQALPAHGGYDVPGTVYEIDLD